MPFVIVKRNPVKKKPKTKIKKVVRRTVIKKPPARRRKAVLKPVKLYVVELLRMKGAKPAFYFWNSERGTWALTRKSGTLFKTSAAATATAKTLIKKLAATDVAIRVVPA